MSKRDFGRDKFMGLDMGATGQVETGLGYHEMKAHLAGMMRAVSNKTLLSHSKIISKAQVKKRRRIMTELEAIEQPTSEEESRLIAFRKEAFEGEERQARRDVDALQYIEVMQSICGPQPGSIITDIMRNKESEGGEKVKDAILEMFDTLYRGEAIMIKREIAVRLQQIGVVDTHAGVFTLLQQMERIFDLERHCLTLQGTQSQANPDGTLWEAGVTLTTDPEKLIIVLERIAAGGPTYSIRDLFEKARANKLIWSEVLKTGRNSMAGQVPTLNIQATRSANLAGKEADQISGPHHKEVAPIVTPYSREGVRPQLYPAFDDPDRYHLPAPHPHGYLHPPAPQQYGHYAHYGEPEYYLRANTATLGAETTRLCGKWNGRWCTYEASYPGRKCSFLHQPDVDQTQGARQHHHSQPPPSHSSYPPPSYSPPSYPPSSAYHPPTPGGYAPSGKQSHRSAGHDTPYGYGQGR